MNQFQIELIKVLELLGFKYMEWENHTYLSQNEESSLPELSLYDDDFKSIDMDYRSASHALRHLQQRGLIMIDWIGDPLKFDPSKDNFDSSDIVNGSLRVMVYNIIGSTSVFTELERLKGNSIEEDVEYLKPTFDKETGHLFVKGYDIKIPLQDKITNDVKVLNYIFNSNSGNLEEETFYSEMAESEFGEFEYGKNKNSWKRYHTSCKSINDKISLATKGKISNFLIFNTGNMGRVRINGEYIAS